MHKKLASVSILTHTTATNIYSGLAKTYATSSAANTNPLLWSPYGIKQTIIFSCCYLFFLLLLFFPRLISAAADWMSAILPHMVWP